MTFNSLAQRLSDKVGGMIVPPDAMTGWDFFRALLGCAADSRRVGTQSSRPQSFGSMLTLFHHPFCPHSRFIRLALAEHGLEHRVIEERVCERRGVIIKLNTAASTPVRVED